MTNGYGPRKSLKTMSLDNLLSLKSRIEATLAAKVTDERRALELELSKLTRFQGGAGRGKVAFGRGGARGSVAPKYRNPENPAETWAGRGLKPRWLAAAIKGGKKLEDFGIVPPAAAASKKPRKAKKVAKK
jgi:DNA-binding protein H-NS